MAVSYESWLKKSCISQNISEETKKAFYQKFLEKKVAYLSNENTILSFTNTALKVKVNEYAGALKNIKIAKSTPIDPSVN